MTKKIKISDMPAKLIRSLYNIKPEQQGGVVTIGNFDGVHLGHQALIRRAVDKAKELGVKTTVMTFEPHPFEFFAGDAVTIPRITRLREKFAALRRYGVDYVLIMPFDQLVASKSAGDFVHDILYQQLQARHIVVGDDFQFGHKRQGDFRLLAELGERYGYGAEFMPTLKVDGERVSSTLVRKLLQEGDHALTEKLLGRPYTMQGRVRPGEQLGRQWGYPTANIYLHRKLSPISGIYTVLVHGLADHAWPAVAYLGVRPTLNGTRTLLEVHLLDFDQEIYGRYVEVQFCRKLRDDKRFETVDLLKEQIAIDVAESREYFQKQGML